MILKKGKLGWVGVAETRIGLRLFKIKNINSLKNHTVISDKKTRE